MFQTISNMWRVKDIRQRILFTLAIIIIFRIGAHIPVPMVNTDVLRFDSGALTNGRRSEVCRMGKTRRVWT